MNHCAAYAGPAITVSVNTGNPPGLMSPISDACADAFAASSTPVYGEHELAILTNNVCHLLSAVISG